MMNGTRVLQGIALAWLSILSVAPARAAGAAEATVSGVTFSGEHRGLRMTLVRCLYPQRDASPCAPLRDHSRAVMAAALLEEQGAETGIVVIGEFAPGELDELAVANQTAELTTEPIDFYKLDGGYARDRSEPAGAEMFLVRRVYAGGDAVEQIRAAQDAAHNEHLLAYGRTIISAALVARADRAGGISISDYSRWEDIARYVYEDPFTRAGMFQAITIERVALIALDGAYERAPSWFYDEMKRRQRAAR